MKTLTRLLLIPLGCLAIGLAATSCKPVSTIDTSTQKSQITPDVWLRQAPGNVLSLTDKAGKVLVAGNVLRTLRMGSENETLLVEYKPSTADAGDLKYAQIDLRTASVTPAPTPGADMLKTMRAADLLLPLP